MIKYLSKKTLLSMLAIILTFFLMYLFLSITVRVKGSTDDVSVISDFFNSFFTKFEFGIFYSDEMLEYNKTINEYYFDQYYFTFVITLIPFAISLLISLPISVMLSMYSNKKPIHITNKIFNVYSFIPFIIFPLFAKIIFSNSKYGSYLDSNIHGNSEMIKSLLVPMFTLLISSLFWSIAIFKKAIDKIMLSVYITTAKAGGLSWWEISKHHLFKNILILFSRKFLDLFLIFSIWTMIIEVVFKIPGISLGLQLSLKYGEINFVMLFFMMYFVKAILINLFSVYIETIFDKSKEKTGLSGIRTINNYRAKKMRTRQFQDIEETLSIEVERGRDGR